MSTDIFPLPPNYIFQTEIPSGFLGHTAIVKNSENQQNFICKSIEKERIGGPDKLQRFKERLDHIQSVKNPYVLSYTEIVDTQNHILLFRPYINSPPIIESFAPSTPDGPQNTDTYDDETVFAFWTNICQCFHSMHSHHIFPNMIKPHNIFIVNKSSVVITDLYPPSNDLDIMLHSPSSFDVGFLAPEFFNQQPTEIQSDLWSLGVLLCFMLTHSLPWPSKNLFTMLQQINTCNMKFSRPIDPKYETIIRSLLQVNPEERVLKLKFTSSPRLNAVIIDNQTENTSPLTQKNDLRLNLNQAKPLSTRTNSVMIKDNNAGRLQSSRINNIGFLRLQGSSARPQNGSTQPLRSTTTQILKVGMLNTNFPVRSRIAPSQTNQLNSSQMKLPSLNPPV